MSSWFKCDCGNLLHTNLFAGAELSFLVGESILDVDFAKLSAQRLRVQIVDCPRILRCKTCRRVYILDAAGNCLSAYNPATDEPGSRPTGR